MQSFLCGCLIAPVPLNMASHSSAYQRFCISLRTSGSPQVSKLSHLLNGTNFILYIYIHTICLSYTILDWPIKENNMKLFRCINVFVVSLDARSRNVSNVSRIIDVTSCGSVPRCK